MVLDLIVIALIPIYFFAWVTGCIEGLLFVRFARRRQPEVAAFHYPGLLKGSIHLQLKTTRWLWNREYVSLDDPQFTQRADVHRQIGFGSLIVMVIAMIGLLVGGRIVFTNQTQQTNEAESVLREQQASRVPHQAPGFTPGGPGSRATRQHAS